MVAFVGRKDSPSDNGKADELLHVKGDSLMTLRNWFAFNDFINVGVHDIEPQGRDQSNIGSFMEVERKLGHFLG